MIIKFEYQKEKDSNDFRSIIELGLPARFLFSLPVQPAALTDDVFVA